MSEVIGASHCLQERFKANPLLLAPMAGVNDPVFRLICKEMGAGLTYTEMISAKGMSQGNARTFEMLTLEDGEKPVAVQLFGSEPQVMARQAAEVEQLLGEGLALIDINMGCPARKVAGKGEGAALMREPERARAILTAVVRAVEAPVTVKFRKGYERADDTAVAFAQMAQECGVAALAVHGRTAKQFYQGTSDRSVVGRVKEAVTVPVVASGDVFAANDVAAYRTEHGADAVMLARGAQGNPWLFRQAAALLAGDAVAAATAPTLQERVELARRHVLGIAEAYPAKLASLRRHVSWYFKGTPNAAALRRAVHTCTTPKDYEALFDRIQEQ